MNWKLARKAPRLAARAEIIRKIREFFSNRGYLETDTPVLIPAPAPESHIDAVKAGNLYLQTSPELCMKRLLAAGYPKVFQICRCWRDGERGSRHLPEFTMLEWYRSNSDYTDLMSEVAELLRHVAGSAATSGTARYRGFEVDFNSGCEMITVRDAFTGYTGTTMEKALEEDNFDLLMAEAIEPRLGTRRPTIIYDYPAEKAALSRLKNSDPSVAERFELYLAGMEIANAFSELADPEAQRERFLKEIAYRKMAGYPVYPMPEPFLAELGEMPPSAGIALGIDRLVMFLTGSETIDEVVAFTPEEL
jgi:elongation factor P--(R)-beta-lysine ligase